MKASAPTGRGTQDGWRKPMECITRRRLVCQTARNRDPCLVS